MITQKTGFLGYETIENFNNALAQGVAIDKEIVSFCKDNHTHIIHRQSFPESPAVYIVWTDKEVVYIGQTSNLLNRFKNHHRLVDFAQMGVNVSWLDCGGLERLDVERCLIKLFNPQLNNTILGDAEGSGIVFYSTGGEVLDLYKQRCLTDKAFLLISQMSISNPLWLKNTPHQYTKCDLDKYFGIDYTNFSRNYKCLSTYNIWKKLEGRYVVNPQLIFPGTSQHSLKAFEAWKIDKIYTPDWRANKCPKSYSSLKSS